MERFFKNFIAGLARMVNLPEPPPEDREALVRQQLLSQNIILLRGNVNQRMLDFARNCVDELTGRGSPDVDVWITSDGGSVNIGMNIYDLLRLYAGKKRGRVISYADSMALVILQSCTVRTAERHATFLVHHVSRNSLSLGDMLNEGRFRGIVDELQQDQQYIYDVLCERTGQSESAVRSLCAQNRRLTAREARDQRLIDTIL